MQANQWSVAKAGGVEAVVGSMTAFPANALVQLSALLCLIPLALDNASLQAHAATLALPAVVFSLRSHVQHADIQAKGLVVLGVLGQVRVRSTMCMVLHIGDRTTSSCHSRMPKDEGVETKPS